jgi:DNA-directed RNA polymerase sigma subunit (sigma70/sigma32)
MLLDLQPTPESLLLDKERIALLHGAIGELPERTRDVIRWRFGLDDDCKTLQAIGDIIGRHRQVVHSIETKGLRTLRRRLGRLDPFIARSPRMARRLQAAARSARPRVRAASC